MIYEIEEGKKYRLIDVEGFVTFKGQAEYNRRLLSNKDVFDENLCVVITTEGGGFGGNDEKKYIISPDEYHLFELVNEEPKVITPETKVTITTTYGELVRAYFVMGSVTGRSGEATLWKTAGSLLGDESRINYTNFNPVADLVVVDYAKYQEDWEALFFKSKEQQEKELVIKQKREMIAELEKEIIRLSV